MRILWGEGEDWQRMVYRYLRRDPWQAASRRGTCAELSAYALVLG